MPLSPAFTIPGPSSQGRQPSYDTVRAWMTATSPAPVAQSRPRMSGALNYASRSASLREYGVSDSSSSSDETVDPPSSPTPSVCPKLEHDNSRHASISSTASTQSKVVTHYSIFLDANSPTGCTPSPVQMSVEAVGPDRQVERSGDDSSCVLVRELRISTESISNHTSRLLSL